MKDKIFKRKTPLIIAVMFVIGCLCGGLIYNAFAGMGGNISVEEAKKIALEYAGVTAPKATFTKAELKKEKETEIYHIDFYTAANSYEFQIDARNGTVLKQSNAAREDVIQGYIGIKEAKKIAYQHAKVTAAQVQLVKCELNTEDEVQVYVVSFSVGNAEYEYTIDAKTGKIIGWRQETYHYNNQRSKQKNNKKKPTEPTTEPPEPPDPTEPPEPPDPVE